MHHVSHKPSAGNSQNDLDVKTRVIFCLSVTSLFGSKLFVVHQGWHEVDTKSPCTSRVTQWFLFCGTVIRK